MEQLTHTSGIYYLKINNKLYIGSSVNTKKRVREHYNALVKNKHYNYKLQNAYNTFLNIEVGYLRRCENITREDLLKIEKFYIDRLRPFYNITKDPTSPSEEDRERISIAIKKAYSEGRLINPWTKNGIKVNVYDYTGLLVKENLSTEEAATFTNVSNRSVINNSIRSKRYIVGNYFVLPSNLDYIETIKSTIQENYKFFKIYKITPTLEITEAHNQGRFFSKLNSDYFYISINGDLFCRKGLIQNALSIRNNS